MITRTIFEPQHDKTNTMTCAPRVVANVDNFIVETIPACLLAVLDIDRTGIIRIYII